MKKFILVLSLFAFTIPLFGSGSDTVFKPISQYRLTDDLSEVITPPNQKDKLSNLDRPILVVKVGWRNYWEAYVYICFGFNVGVQLKGYEPFLIFSWDATLEAITAEGPDGVALYILSP